MPATCHPLPLSSRTPSLSAPAPPPSQLRLSPPPLATLCAHCVHSLRAAEHKSTRAHAVCTLCAQPESSRAQEHTRACHTLLKRRGVR
eukprot:2933319-Rhodomonas_salina.1